MKITYYGQSCVLIETAGKKLLFDPFIMSNPKAQHIDPNSIKPDYILLSHGHGDHVADVIAIEKSSGAKVICIGGGYNFDFGRVKMVNAIHSSSMPDGSYGGNPAGFLIHSEGKVIYFAGDTALTYDMKLLADENIDWSILPIGDNYTMGVDDAIKASAFVNCPNVIGVHYNTFPVIEINTDEALEKFVKAGLNLKLPAIGETLSL